MSATPPSWDLTSLFASLDAPELHAALADVKARIAALPTLPPTDATSYDAVTTMLNALLDDVRTVRAYPSLRTAADSRDEAAQALLSSLKLDMVKLSQFETRYVAWLGTLDIDALLETSEVARAHEFALRQAQVSAAHLMAPGEETLASDLSLSGRGAWARLHSDVTSQLEVTVDGTALPMAAVRQRAMDASEAVRKSAYDAELAAWKTVATPLAAAMNAIKYETNVLAEKRGWSDALEVSCFGNHIDRATLDAMMAAADKSFPDFRRYLKAKARLLGTETLPWWNLFAPVGQSSREWSWPEAEAFVAENFDVYSKKLGDFAREAFEKKWIDAALRPGKRDGAFCAGVKPGESRLLQNFSPSFDAVGTLAHELGHAYHNRCLEKRTFLQCNTPMTLAETASIFCQTIIQNAALAATTDSQERLALLDGAISDACQVVVDITSRFRFEQAVLAKRKERELSVDELCALMLDSQKQTYGDGLDAEALHPFMWAVKGHYYGSTFYNFPYMFGLLFGLGLYAIYQKSPETFKEGYDELLSRTGMADAKTLAAGFGIDITQEAFWSASLAVVKQDIDAFEALAG